MDRGGICKVDNVLPIRHLWFGSYTYTNCAVIYNVYWDVLLMRDVIYFIYLTDEGNNGLWGSVFSVPDVDNTYSVLSV